MRKILIALCLALCLTGCGKPANVSEDVYNLGLKAVDVTEQFLSADLTADEAKEKLDEIKSRIVEDDAYSNDLLVGTEIELIAYSIGFIDGNPTEDDIKEVKERLDDLKEDL